MTIITFQDIQNTQEVTQITQAHITNMRETLEAGYRAEVYLYYAKLLGSSDESPFANDNEAITQLMIQAQITTYSGIIGGSATQGNFYAKTSNQAEYGITLDEFSKRIIDGMIDSIEADISLNNPNGAQNGILADDEIQASDQNTWDQEGMKDYFPGNIQLTGQEANADLSLATNLFLAAQSGLNSQGGLMGNRYNEFSLDDYDLMTEDHYDLFINKNTGIIEGVFPTATSNGTLTGLAYLGNVALNDQPDFITKLIREEKWLHLGANDRNGPSIFDILKQVDNVYALGNSAIAFELEAILLNYFHTAEESYNTYANNILALSAGERALFYNDITGYDLYTVDNDLISPDPLEIELNHTENAVIDLTDGTGVNSSTNYTVSLNNSANQTFQLTYGNNIILDGNRSDANGIDTADYSQVGSTTGLLFNLQDGSVKFQGSTSIKDYVGKQITHYIASDYDDQFDIYKSYKSFQNPYRLTSFEGKSGIDTYNANEDFKDTILEDDGGVLLIDNKALLLSVEGDLLEMVSDGGELRSFTWEHATEYTKPDGTVVTQDNLVLTEVDSTGATLENTVTILDYSANRANWNFSVGEHSLVEGGNNYDFLTGETVLGESGDELIVAKGGDDWIFGLHGFDRLVGGLGADHMSGGADNDIFAYTSHEDSQRLNSLTGIDFITDFTQGEDKIDVTGLGFSNVAASGLGGVNALEYEIINSDTYLSNDATDFLIHLNGPIAFTTSDFIGLTNVAQNLAGDHGDNMLIGGGFSDTITGHGGDDVVILHGGDDVADLGSGAGDKVVYAATSANYTLSTLSSQTITVTDNVGSDGVDSLNNVEIVEFSDTTFYWSGSTWAGTAPDAAPIADDESIITDFESAVTINVLFNDSDAEDESFNNSNLSIDTNPANGAVAINNNGTITYTPNTDFSGSDSFIYTLTDSAGGTDTATVQIIVGAAPANQAPVANNDTVVTEFESNVTVSVLTNDSDDGTLDGSNITIDTDPTNGAALVNVDGTITYTPDAGYDGADSFVYMLTDSEGVTDTATVNVTVNPIPSNYAPDALDDTTIVDQDTAIAISVLANDSDIEDSSFTNSNLSIDSSPANGITSINSNGTITYTPNANYVGTDSFTYTLTDSSGETDTATVNISVQAAIDPNPTATHNGDSGNNNITSGSGADVLFGYAGDDVLYGVSGDDQLVGGTGNDTLKGYKGNDTYLWSSGDGNDLIQESNTSSSGTDILHITGGATLADVAIYGFTSADLKIEHIATNEIITIENQYHNDTDYRVESITFDDGSSYSLLQGTTWLGGIGSQNLYGSIYDDTMFGGKDNDTVNGGSGDDTLSGDLGDDKVYGYTGNDTYRWKSGDGNDLFIEQNYSASANDVLHLTGGITFSDLRLHGFTSHDLKIEHIPTNEILTIQNQYHSDADYHIETLLFDDGSSYNLNQATVFLGGIGSQSLEGSIYNDTMFGGKNDDTVRGGAGNDTISGDLGDDVMYGYTGNDTYIWQSGRGNDIFIEQNYSASASDVLYLKGGITLADLDIYGSTSHDVKITHTPTGEILTLQNQLHSDTDYQIETLQFDDGTSYNLLQAVEWRGGTGNDNLDGSIYNDTMLGGAGNDSLKGGAGDDLILGGTGDDKLYGYTGNDTYIWHSGDGNDTFIEQNYSASATDVIRLVGGITLADLDIYGSTSHDVKIIHTPTGEILTLENQLHSDTDYQIETLQFDDGTSYNLLQAVEWRGGTGNDNLDGSIYDDTMLGGAGNDSLKGSLGNDTLIGNEGDDKLYGYKGDDTYVWESGDGNDIFIEQNRSASAADVLLLTGGIIATDVIFSQSGNDLLITHTPTGEILTIDNQYSSDTDYHIETLAFDNGTTVDLLGV